MLNNGNRFLYGDGGEFLQYVLEACPKVDECKELLVETCIALRHLDFPVLVVLEIHEKLCRLKKFDVRKKYIGRGQFRVLERGADLPVSLAVRWEIAKTVKHFGESNNV